jgi:hypothetical protein
MEPLRECIADVGHWRAAAVVALPGGSGQACSGGAALDGEH